MWGGLRRAKKQITHILQQSRTSRELYTIRTSLQSLWEIGRTLNTTVKNCCPSGLFFFPSEGKKNWLALSTGILKNTLHKSITVNNLLPLGMDASKLWKLGTRNMRCQGIVVLFIAQRRPWTNFPPWPLDFLTTKMGVLQGPKTRENESLSLVIFYYRLYVLKGFFT